ncbi:MAG: AAA family ATPase [Nitrospirae bacterium]|nr:AAA family ATPase [Nitrospirota bacterium]
MHNSTESAEKAHLEQIKRKLNEALERLDGRVRRYATDIKEQKTYLSEHRAAMDHVEKVSARDSVQQAMRTAETVVAFRKRIQKLIRSPYFGRIDFRRHGEVEPLPVYVGTHAFSDEAVKEHLVFDWRAPVSTMFYDYEPGEAHYESPAGRVSGEITLKRQYRIRDGHMEFMLESGLNIMDDILQEELSRTSDDRMKNIVATIQRDQNVIIRNEDAKVLVIQGVAGSGKTSIALHRIAFLLYRFRERLTSKDILIISPNKVFSDFISNVLPELGEEQIAELEMETLARELLDHKYTFQTALEQSAALIENRDDALRRRIEEKSSVEFLRKLDEYAAHVLNSRFRAEDVRIGGHLVPADFIRRMFKKRRDMPLPGQLRWVADCVEHELGVRHHYEITAQERTGLKSQLKKCSRDPALRTLYKEFFKWMGKPELFKPGRNSSLEYADVFPMIYLGITLKGLAGHDHGVKHLVIDEMQDYTPVQYAVIAKLFRCDKTILGDENQAINAFSSSTSEMISGVFRHAECVRLCKSYRSSYEITRFAQGISPNSELVAIERHGPRPLVVACGTAKEETRRIRREIKEFRGHGQHTMGIICKTQKQAEQLHKAICKDVPDVHLLTARSSAFVQGVVVCAAHLAKGLEFDQVVVSNASDTNYTTELDRNLLYVACTRAMHELLVTHVGAITRFISAESPHDEEEAA